MNSLASFMVATPIFSIFICLGLGYLLGKVKFGSFNLGATVGVLIVSLIIGQVGVFTRDKVLGSIFFDAFMFAVGYRVGPSFVSSMKKFGTKIVIQSLFYLMSAFLVALACFKIFHVGPGIAAGTIAGSLTQSAVIGSSLQTITKLPVSAAVKSTYAAQIPIVYALTYVFGTIGVLIFLRDIAPKLLHIDIKKQSTDVALKMKFHTAQPTRTRIRTFEILSESRFIGWTLPVLSKSIGYGVVVLKGYHNGNPIDDNYELQAGDQVTLAGYMNDVSKAANGEDVSEVGNPKSRFKEKMFVIGRHFKASQIQKLQSNGVFVNFFSPKDGNEQKVEDLRAGSIIGLTGTGESEVVKDTLKQMGSWRSERDAINYALFCFGIAFSALLGVVGIKANGIPLELGDGTAALLLGLVMSIWVNRYQSLDSIPDSVMMFFQSLGLNLFIVTVGLSAARTFVGAFKSIGISIFLIGAIISILPHIIALYFGKWVLHMEPISLIGSLTGADTLSAGLNAITVKSGEIGGPYYAATVAPAYVIGNIVLTLLGPIFLVLLS
ncbi:putative transport protein [Secundilactobacillus pentosiphilus]|uniref:Putative transport protein n=1 Tax=Secundilactobacillus pentosiphilus TaxID=1714682 RepID=A0A1Z5ISN7_9LACO|nr:YidE/YbjL duplication [Secundilactobacillus pentosiphilus]GAX04760.1 putative transport protein [Secundilactobacillus pentosiphilus]